MSGERPTTPLPTTPGAVIRWSIRLDGDEHYGAALLDYDGDSPVWYMAGFDRECTPAEVRALLADRDWHEVTR